MHNSSEFHPFRIDIPQHEVEVGVPLPGPGSVAAGSISISGPSSRFLPVKYPEYGEAAAGTAREISRALGAFSVKGY